MIEPTRMRGAAHAHAGALAKPRVWHLLVLFLLAQALSIFLTAIAIGVVAAGRGQHDVLQQPGLLKEIALSPEVIAFSIGAAFVAHTSLALLVGVLSPHPFVLRLRLSSGRLSLGELGVAVLGFLALSNACDALLRLLPGYAKGGISVFYGVVGHLAGRELWLILALAGVAAPVAEELFFRGVLQTRLAERFGRAAGLVLASLAFGLCHLEPIHMLFGLVAGLYLGWISDLASSCRASVAAHVVNNTAGVLCAIWMASTAAVLNDPIVAAGSAVLAAASGFWLWRRARDRRQATSPES